MDASFVTFLFVKSLKTSISHSLCKYALLCVDLPHDISIKYIRIHPFKVTNYGKVHGMNSLKLIRKEAISFISIWPVCPFFLLLIFFFLSACQYLSTSCWISLKTQGRSWRWGIKTSWGCWFEFSSATTRSCWCWWFRFWKSCPSSWRTRMTWWARACAVE